MWKNFAWMLLSTALRLASGLLVFVIAARQLGAVEFGVLMTVFAATGILAIPVNFGLSMFLLHEAAKSEDGGARLLSQAFGLKLLLAVPATLIVLCAASWLGLPLPAMLLLFLMHVIEACTELFCVRQRATGDFDRETKFVTSQSVMQFALIATTACLRPSIEWVAFAFFASRLMSFVTAGFSFGLFGDGFRWPTLTGGTAFVRRTTPFLLDYGAQSVLVQVDAVLLGALAGPAAVGVYQAGMRVVHGISQVISVMVNVALPRLSRRVLTQAIDGWLAAKVWIAFSAIGALLATPLLCFGPQVSQLFFGATFDGLSSVLETLGLFLIVRFSAAGSGMLLIAMGEQRLRAGVMLSATAVLGVFGYFLMPQLGAIGAAYSILGAYGFILISQTILAAYRLRQRVTTSI
jgi:O-antigen/teichoic acid export membrane protein